MRSRCELWGNTFVLAASLAFGSFAANAEVVAESNPSGISQITGFGSDGVYIPVQTFTPTSSGQLTTIEVPLGMNGPMPSAVFMDFRELTSDGEPGAVLGTATITAPMLPTDYLSYVWFTFDFLELNLTIEAGNRYGFSFRSTFPGGANVFGWNDEYADGNLWSSYTSGATWLTEPYDWAFRVSAQSVVPDAYALLEALRIKASAVEMVGSSLTDKVALAQTYFIVPDVMSACAVMTALQSQIQALAGKKKMTTVFGQELSTDTLYAMTVMGCFD